MSTRGVLSRETGWMCWPRHICVGLNDLAEVICRGFMVESAEETAISLHESFYFNGNWKVKKSRRDVFFLHVRDFQWSEVCGKNLGKLSGRETGETSEGLRSCQVSSSSSWLRNVNHYPYASPDEENKIWFLNIISNRWIQIHKTFWDEVEKGNNKMSSHFILEIKSAANIDKL